MKINWTTRKHNVPGNAMGYNHHNSMMMDYTDKYFTHDDGADIALHIVPADFFRPVRGKVNVLFTMFEFMDLPNSYLARLPLADVLVVPCGWCRDLFRKYFKGPIYVCHEGITPEDFPFYQRRRPIMNEKFRFLWVGAPNPRKGYPCVLEAIKVFENNPSVEIYMKTTTQEADRKKYIEKLWRTRRDLRSSNPKMFKEMLSRSKNPNVANQIKKYGKYDNIIWDSRKISFGELKDLYNSAHAFLLPTFGEGWGLTITEAMATGAPVIATPITGVSEYFDDSVGYSIKYQIKEMMLENYKLKTRGYVPNTLDMVNQMVRVITHYDEALKKGKRASSRIHSKFTWEQAARRLYEIIKEVDQKCVKTLHSV